MERKGKEGKEIRKRKAGKKLKERKRESRETEINRFVWGRHFPSLSFLSLSHLRVKRTRGVGEERKGKERKRKRKKKKEKGKERNWKPKNRLKQFLLVSRIHFSVFCAGKMSFFIMRVTAVFLCLTIATACGFESDGRTTVALLFNLPPTWTQTVLPFPFLSFSFLFPIPFFPFLFFSFSLLSLPFLPFSNGFLLFPCVLLSRPLFPCVLLSPIFSLFPSNVHVVGIPFISGAQSYGT